MQWRNRRDSYGWIAIGLHWLVAVAVIGLFASGWWMVGLSYYQDWYHRAPALHKSAGLVLFAVLLLRLAWRAINPVPEAPGRPWEQRAGRWAHRGMLTLLLAVMVAGYLISTAAGKGIPVFGLFEVPATLHGLPGQEDWAGWAHRWLAYALMALVALHTAAALKHQFLDRDGTLTRMLRPGGRRTP